MNPARVQDIVAAAAREWPDRPALVDEQGVLTFRQLHEAVERTRDALVARGVRPGMGLGLMARNGRGFVTGLFAGVGTGATVMPVSHQHKPAELAAETAQAGLHAILDDLGGATPAGARAGEFSLEGRPARLTWTGRDPERRMVPHLDAVFARFSSGTTGRAKGVVLGNQAVLERVAVAHELLPLGPGDTVAWVLPMAYHFVVSVVFYLRHGACLAVCRDLLARHILDTVREHQATLLYASPMHYRLLASDPGTGGLESLRWAVSTSSALPPETARAFRARYGIPARQGYGIIEAGLPILNLRGDVDDPRALGDPAPSMTVGILDEAGNPCAPDTVGRLALRGPGLFDGYLDPPLTRDQVLDRGWFLTGDLARRDTTGLVWLQGREKTMINVSGNKVFPEEVEAVLSAHPAVEQCRVFGEPHPLTGEIVAAEVVPREGETFAAEALHRYCRDRLTTFKVPQRIRAVTHIPLTPSGKTARP